MPDTDLTKRHCVPCEGGTDPLTQEQEEMYLSAVPNWEIKREGTHTVQRDIECKNFLDAVELIKKIAAIAEEEGHHPDLRLHSYKFLEVTLTTHAIKGLSENDFILAAKIDELLV
jgi:4a-hydroxytetrahydrobiopterin dehydratase